MLYNMRRIILDLSDSVREKRSNLQQLRLKLKLYSVLVNQVISITIVTFLYDFFEYIGYLLSNLVYVLY